MKRMILSLTILMSLMSISYANQDYAAKAQDCIQAFEKAKARLAELEDIEVFGKYKNILIRIYSKYEPEKISLAGTYGAEISDFSNKGVFVRNNNYFIYTKDTEYANGDYFKDKGFLYKRDGVYKYTTITGATNSVKAYRETKHKVSEIQPRTYLQDQSLECCYSSITDSHFGEWQDVYGASVDGKCFNEKGKLIRTDWCDEAKISCSLNKEWF